MTPSTPAIAARATTDDHSMVGAMPLTRLAMVTSRTPPTTPARATASRVETRVGRMVPESGSGSSTASPSEVDGQIVSADDGRRVDAVEQLGDLALAGDVRLLV